MDVLNYSTDQFDEHAPLIKDNMGTDNFQAETHADEVIQETPKRKWQSYIWDSLDKSPEERKFLAKLDSAVLTFASLGYLIKYLDQSNINNAFVSGMQDDLQLYGNQLNYMQTCWTVGYVVGQIPSNLILTRVRPSIWIPTMEIIWGVLTFCLSQCNTAESIYAVRFLVGLAESSFYPGMQYLIGSWYRKDELGKRSCIFHTSSAIATMFSGYLMAAVYHLEGVGGLHGWQWLFVVDGIITLPIAILGFAFLPDQPDICRVWYLSEDEKAFGRKRMELEGRKSRAPYTKAKVKRIFKSWHIYMLTLLYVTFNNGNGIGAAPVFAQYLHYSKDPVYENWQVNVYPTATNAVQVVTTLFYAWTSDTIFRGARWPAMLIGGTMNIITSASLAYWNVSHNWKWACYILMGFGGGLSGLCFAWCHEICSDDNEERALVAATMNEMAYVCQAWLPLIIWQQVDAPEYHTGFITVSCISALLMITALVLRQLHQKESQRKQTEAETSEGEDSLGSADRTETSMTKI